MAPMLCPLPGTATTGKDLPTTCKMNADDTSEPYTGPQQRCRHSRTCEQLKFTVRSRSSLKSWTMPSPPDTALCKQRLHVCEQHKTDARPAPGPAPAFCRLNAFKPASNPANLQKCLQNLCASSDPFLPWSLSKCIALLENSRLRDC